MKELKSKYHKLLMIELDDLAEDLEFLYEQNCQKRDNGEITNYVYMENISLVQHEIACVKDFMTYCEIPEVANPANLSSIADLGEHFFQRLKERARQSDYPEAVLRLVGKKLKKIAVYLESE
jgi:hypothetical protein